jgi:predicted hydrocarbon binding protein
MSSVLCQHGVVGIGAASIRTLRAALGQDLGEDVGATRVQEMGFAAGAEVYQSFCAWLPSHADLRDPADLSADALPEVLSAFFGALGWGTVSTERVGERGLVVASPDWAESAPGTSGEGPACVFSTGLLASFFTSLAHGSALAAMEIECRAQGDARCRFLIGSPATLAAVYDAASRGADYRTALGA